jgi:hypothetical protein
MSLKHVKNYGTEGRRLEIGSDKDEIPPSEALLGMVKFKVELIEKFEVV